tara:strand:- start:4788 stop:5057 length:270 start_codon:yes stop_codon:yes gene_type:complete
MNSIITRNELQGFQTALDLTFPDVDIAVSLRKGFDPYCDNDPKDAICVEAGSQKNPHHSNKWYVTREDGVFWVHYMDALHSAVYLQRPD